MAATDTVGISRLVLARRERAVMLQARGKGIVLWTLRYGDEVRDPKEVFGDVEEKTAEPKLVTLVQKLIDALQAPWDPAIGRASCRARVCQDVSISVVDVSLKKEIEGLTGKRKGNDVRI